MKPRKSGWQSVGRDLSSGWNWLARNQGCSVARSSIISTSDPSGERPLALAGEAVGGDLALGPAWAEPHRHEDPVGRPDALGQALLLDLLRVDVGDTHPTLVGDAAVGERLVQALVGVGQVDVLAD